MTRERYILANWKSHKTLVEAMHWLDVVGPRTLLSSATIILCPPFPFVVPVAEEIRKKKYKMKLGVQDLSPFPAGSYTGAVSVRNLEGLGVEYALLGHVEQRKYFHETDQRVANKAEYARESGIRPIICVEENQIISQSGVLDKATKKVTMTLFEPSGHIGTGEAAGLDEVVKAAEKIHKHFSADTPVIYGGSVDARTAEQFFTHPELAGFGVGTASLDADQFANLITGWDE